MPRKGLVDPYYPQAYPQGFRKEVITPDLNTRVLRTSVIAIVLCSAFHVYAAQTGETWMVLPDSVDVYTSSSLQAGKARFKLHYPQTIRATGTLRAASSCDFRPFEHKGETYWVPEPLVLRISEAPSPEINLPVDLEGVAKLRPVSPDYRPSDLAPIPAQYCLNDLPHKLRREAVEACIQMLQDARKAGLDIRIVSSYRTFTNQRYLYMKAIKKHGLEQDGVAKPGHSQHQLGTAIDVIGRDLQVLFKEAFGETPEGKWLIHNAGKYGFMIPYQKENVKQTGYKYEPWHLRYVGKP